MTQAELLNYILKKEKLEKEDLAKLLGIRRKNIEKTFNGEMELSKKQIKYVSEFTLLPQEVIKSGEVVLPDLENTGVVFIDEEWVKNQNTERFKNFIKNRFKIQFISLFLLKLFIYFILILFSIFTGCAFYSAFIENFDMSITFPAFFTLFPYLLGFASIVPIFKVIRKINFNEVKRAKIYYYFIIIANLISIISLIVLNANHWGFFAVGLIGTLIPLVFLILENNKKSSKKQIKILSTVLIFACCLIIALIPDYPETDREFYFGIIFIGLNLVLVAAHICYWGIKNFSGISNKFQMLNNKKCFKKRKVLHSLISVLLVTTIVAGGTHFWYLYTKKLSIKVVLEEYKFETYKEYKFQDIVFTDEDETITLENGNFTYKIPAGLIDKTNRELQSEEVSSLTYKNEAETIVVSSIYDCKDIPFSSVFDYDTNMYDSSDDEVDFFLESKKIAMPKAIKLIEETITEKYGFVPQNYYEYQKLGALLNFQEIDSWNRQETLSHAFLVFLYAPITPLTYETYFYETGENAGIILCNRSENEETGEIRYMYHYSFGKSTDEWLDGRVIINLPEEVASTDLAYKIINSVEMK